MMDFLYRPMAILAQAAPWDDLTEGPQVPPAKRMSFSDLQAGMKAYQDGEADHTLRNGLVVLVVAVVIFAIILHLRQRRQNAGPLDSSSKLGWELSKLISFPFGSRVALWWVSRTTKTPFATLLISAELFDRNVEAWANRATFSLARRWGRGRLSELRPRLFS